MLIRFSLENWMSFRERATFSMVASRERQHRSRVPRIAKYRASVLPVAAIYGGNASGKTNLFMALAFAQKFIVDGIRPKHSIPVKPFLLDSAGTRQPSHFVFELLVNETIYEFSFAVTRAAVLEEKLVVISSAREQVLYHRHGEQLGELSKRLNNSPMFRYAFKGTRKNQLFLANAISQKVGEEVDELQKVHDWFEHSLVLIDPDSRFLGFHQFFKLDRDASQILRNLDTGIVRMDSEEASLNTLDIPERIKADLEELAEGTGINLVSKGLRVAVTREEGKLIARKLVTWHPRTDGSEVQFEFSQESDGSRRLIDLLPAFQGLSGHAPGKVYAIDEIDRSLHTHLTRHLLESYLANCSAKSRAQLLMTTHDALLMDQSLFRRDEMWVVERNRLGNSTLIPVSDYGDVRHDKDIRKSYLMGRMGGIPRLVQGMDIGVGTHPKRRARES